MDEPDPSALDKVLPWITDDLTTVSELQAVDFAALAAIDAAAQHDARARNTRQAYSSRWNAYEDWCIGAATVPGAG